jgi:hypothetical protein
MALTKFPPKCTLHIHYRIASYEALDSEHALLH